MNTSPYPVVGIKPTPPSELFGHGRSGQCEVAQVLDSLADRNVKRAGTESQLSVLGMVEGESWGSWIRSKTNEISPFITEVIADYDIVLGGDRRQYRAER